MAEQGKLGNVVHIPGDPPHAVQLVLGDLLESPGFVNVCETANKIADKFKNTKLKGYLKEEPMISLPPKSHFSVGIVEHIKQSFLQHRIEKSCYVPKMGCPFIMS